MQFADVIQNDDETAYELENLMGKPPLMVNASVNNTFSAAAAQKNTTTESQVSSVYINSSAINAFRFLKEVTGVHTKPVSDDTASSDTTHTPSQPSTPSNEQNTTQQEGTQQENMGGAFTAAEDTKTVSLDIALQPLSIRMRIPRTNQLVIDHWTEFESATSSRTLFEAFARWCTVWLRSDATLELDANLFSAVNSKGSRVGVSAADCVNAFIYNDELFLDFIVILADGQSKNSGKTAYVEVFTDDGIPYILIGDGNENGQWDMTFYVAATGDNPTPRDETNTQTPTTNNQSEESSGGGGGCNFGLLGVISTLMLAGIFMKSRA